MKKIVKSLNLKSKSKIAIVASPYYKLIYENLLKGALDELLIHNIDSDIVNVSGALEIPTAINLLKGNYSGFIALGCVIRGETSHFDYICNSVSNGIMNLNIKLDIPVIFGVLTDNTKQQSIDRSGGKLGNKGTEAAVTAVQMALLK